VSKPLPKLQPGYLLKLLLSGDCYQILKCNDRFITAINLANGYTRTFRLRDLCDVQIITGPSDLLGNCCQHQPYV